jgi:hypothetical protein
MMVITNDILSISTSMHLKIKKGGFVCQAHNKTLRALWKGYKLSIYQSLALGLTTVPIPNPQLRVGQLYPPITHPWHLVHTHYPPKFVLQSP